MFHKSFLIALFVFFTACARAPKETVYSGVLEARTIRVGSLVGGRIAIVHVREGDRVKKGDSLVTLEGDFIELQMAQQRQRIAEARAALARAQRGPRTETIERARAEAENARADLARMEELLKDGVIGAQQRDTARTRASVASQTLLEAERGSRPEDIDQARATLGRETAALAYLERQRKETLVTAPSDGVVETLDLRPGDLLAAQQPVSTLLEDGQLFVRVYVQETELGKVRVGQGANVRIDSFPDRDFEGKVIEVRDRAEYTPRNIQTLDQRKFQVFGVRVDVKPQPELKAGMAAFVRLIP